MATEGKPLQRRRTWTMIAMDLKAIRGMSVKAAFAGFVVGALTGGGLVALTKRVIAQADAMAKTADAIGLSIAAYQEIGHAAQLSGLSVQQFDSAMGALAKRVGEAKVGVGTLTTFLTKFNPELLKQLKGVRDTEAAFNLLVTAASNTADQTKRVALLAAAFGRTAGIAMTNMVKKGTAGIDEMRKSARNLGIVLETETARKAEILNDKLLEISKQISTETTRLFVELGDEIVKTGHKLVDGFKGAKPILMDIIKLVGHLIGGIANLAAAAGGLVRGDAGVLFGGNAVMRVHKIMEAREKALKDKQGTVDEALKDTRFLSLQAFGGPGGTIKGAGVLNLSLADRLGLSTDKPGTSKGGGGGSKIDPFTGLTQEQLRTFQQASLDAQRKLEEARRKAIEGTNKKIEESISQTVDGVNRLADFGLNAIDIFTSNGKDKMKSFRDLSIAMLKDVQRMIWNTFVRTPLQQGLNDAPKGSGGLGNIFKNLFSGGGSGPSVATQAAAFGNKAIGFAAGGTGIVGGRPGRDKNLVMMGLTKGERLTVETQQQQRAADRGRQGGGVTVHITQNFAAGVSRSELVDLVPGITEAAKQGVLDGMARIPRR